MARDFWDGGDLYADVSQIAIKWHVYTGIALIEGRFGEQAFRLTGIPGFSRLVRVLESTDRHSVGVAVRNTGFNRPNMNGMMFAVSSAVDNFPPNRQIGWVVDAEGRVVVYRGANTILWQSLPGVVPNGVWTYIGFSAIIHPTEGAFSVTVKGQTLVEQTGVNTQGQGNNQIASVNFGTGAIGSQSPLDLDDIYFDDLYLANVPERRIETLRPIADVDSDGFAPNTGTTLFGVVGETLVDATNWMAAALPGEFAEFELSNLGNVPTVIDGVQATGFGMKTDAATRAVNYGIKSGAVAGLGPDIYLGSSIEQGWNNLLLNPDGDVAWTPAAVNSVNLLVNVAV